MQLKRLDTAPYMFEWLSLATVSVAGQAYPNDLLINQPSIVSADEILTFLDHDLMTDTPASRVKVHTMFAGKLLNLAVLPQVGLGLILDIVVERHDDLAVVVYLGGADIHEFQSHWPTVVMRHTVVRREPDMVASLDHLTMGEADRVSLDDLFGEGLGIGRGRGPLRGEGSGGIEGALKLRREGVLPSWKGGSVGAELDRS